MPHSCFPYSPTISCVCDSLNTPLHCVSRLRLSWQSSSSSSSLQNKFILKGLVAVRTKDSSHHSPWSKMMRDITMLQVRLSFISRDFRKAQTDFIFRIFFWRKYQLQRMDWTNNTTAWLCLCVWNFDRVKQHQELRIYFHLISDEIVCFWLVGCLREARNKG